MIDCADYRGRRYEDDDEEDKEGDGEVEEEEEEEAGEEQQRSRKQKRKLEEDKNEIAHLNLLVPNLELATGCSPAHLPGGAPSPLAQTLTQRVMTLLHSSGMLGMSPLRIWFRPDRNENGETATIAKRGDGVRRGGDMMDAGGEGGEDELVKAEVKAFWVLYIDVLFISLDGNAFDAAWLAILAALKDTLLPRAWWDADREMVLCSDEVGEAGRLEMRSLPVPLSFGVFEGDGLGVDKGKGGEAWVLVDLDGFEEGLCREVGTVVVGEGGRVLRMEKSGGRGAGMAEMRRLVGIAGRRREEWMGVLGIN